MLLCLPRVLPQNELAICTSRSANSWKWQCPDFLCLQLPYRWQYSVLGSTGNVYQVMICRTPSCTCVDCSGRNQICKHMLFIYHKVCTCLCKRACTMGRLISPPALVNSFSQDTTPCPHAYVCHRFVCVSVHAWFWLGPWRYIVESNA